MITYTKINATSFNENEITQTAFDIIATKQQLQAMIAERDQIITDKQAEITSAYQADIATLEDLIAQALILGVK